MRTSELLVSSMPHDERWYSSLQRWTDRLVKSCISHDMTNDKCLSIELNVLCYSSISKLLNWIATSWSSDESVCVTESHDACRGELIGWASDIGFYILLLAYHNYTYTYMQTKCSEWGLDSSRCHRHELAVIILRFGVFGFDAMWCTNVHGWTGEHAAASFHSTFIEMVRGTCLL
jgi:hypothetical protein